MLPLDRQFAERLKHVIWTHQNAIGVLLVRPIVERLSQCCMPSVTAHHNGSPERCGSAHLSGSAPATDLTGNSGQGGSRSCRCGAPPRIKPDGHGRRCFRSTLDILVRDSSACHERRGKPRRTTKRALLAALVGGLRTLRHQATAAPVVAPLHPSVPTPNGSAHLSFSASGDLPDGELRARRKPKLPLWSAPQNQTRWPR